MWEMGFRCFVCTLANYRLIHVFIMCSCPGLKVEWAEEDQKQGNVVIVPPEIYAKGCVHDVDEGLAVSIFMFIF